jgi:response regulator RpfG family c-di-GMP phosphodiesterase
MREELKFIVIDDDPLNNQLCGIIIRKVSRGFKVTTFNIPEKGYEFIKAEYTETNWELPTILFLDINMPNWSGWDFLEKFETLEENTKKQLRIFMLSSSIDPKDIERAKENKNIIDYIVKPLTKEHVFSILSSLQLDAEITKPTFSN